MKTISEDLEYRKAVNEKHTTLEKEKNQNRRVVELEAQKYLEEKVRLESQIENIQQTIWEDIQDQKDKIEHSLSGNLKHREEKNQIKEQEKTIRQLEERLEKANRDYEMLKELFDIQEGSESTS
jgi:chromosome segregation ATPase